MRCKNCGWENPEGRTECEKCHSKLAATTRQDYATIHVNNDRLNSTVSEKAVFNSNPPGAAAPAQEMPAKPCPRCGYPVGDSHSECPNCGQSMSIKPVPPTRIQRSGMGTVMGGPVVGPSSSHRFCTLRPIAWEGETVDYNPVTYTGETIVLNRSNTDANNNSITSREQAVLTCVDGDWYIENKSELRSTFIRVNGRVKLRSGDIIVLGNREFEFKC